MWFSWWFEALTEDPMAAAFTGWYVRRHGTEPDPEAVGVPAQEWMEGTLPDTWHAVSPHRVAFQARVDQRLDP
jgi:hypothetical protein